MDALRTISARSVTVLRNLSFTGRSRSPATSVAGAHSVTLHRGDLPRTMVPVLSSHGNYCCKDVTYQPRRTANAISRYADIAQA
jgi:hypothetical protein